MTSRRLVQFLYTVSILLNWSLQMDGLRRDSFERSRDHHPVPWNSVSRSRLSWTSKTSARHPSVVSAAEKFKKSAGKATTHLASGRKSPSDGEHPEHTTNRGHDHGNVSDDDDDVVFRKDPTGVTQSSATDVKWKYFVSLDSKGDFKLEWDFDDVIETVYFRITAAIDKSDLLAFGFSDYGEPENADFCVMWTGQDGKHRFQDTHTDAHGLLAVDSQQDYHLDNVKVTDDGRLVVEFHRIYDTCDNDDYMIDTGTTHMLFFVVPGAVQSIDGLDVKMAEPRLQRVQLIKSLLPDPEFPPDTKTFVMHVDDVHVPEEETTYWCAVRLLPEMKEKHHVIRSAISEAGKGIVHHLEVFHCQVPPGTHIPFYDGPCSSKSERPKGLEPCFKVIGAWAMGAKHLSYPEEAGQRIGGPNFSRYVMLEVHYNNPDKVSGLVDSSGIKFYYTKTLRKYDAGIMELGLEYTDKYALPPGLPLWKLAGYCISECTQVSLPPEGIKVFASQLHTHLTGLRAYTKHYRDGIELPELNRDNHFSPHYQEIRKLHRQVTVLPGDALVTTCEDQTVEREEITLGGFSITDEMCVNYVHYYPLIDLEVCKSSVTTSSLYDFFNFLKVYQGEPTSQDYGISDNYKAIHWTPMNVHLLKSFYEMAPLSMQCNQSDGHKFPGEWENAKLPSIRLPAPPPERPCLL